MLSDDLKSHFEAYKETLISLEPLFGFLLEANNYCASIDSITKAILDDNGPLTQFRQIVSNSSSIFSTLKPSVAYRQLDHLTSSLENLLENLPGNSRAIQHAISSATAFREAYDAYLDTRNISNSWTAIKAARELFKSSRSLCDFGDMLCANLSESNPTVADAAVLTLAFEARDDVRSLTKRLEALGSLYAQLSALLNVSTESYPLEIIHLETGSLFAKLAGHPAVISIITSALTAGASHFYHTYTTEGALSAFPRRAEALDSVIKLRTSISAAGIDPATIDSEIQESAQIIGRDLTILLRSQASIKINGKHISAGDEATRKMIANDAPLHLEYGESKNIIDETEN